MKRTEIEDAREVRLPPQEYFKILNYASLTIR